MSGWIMLATAAVDVGIGVAQAIGQAKRSKEARLRAEAAEEELSMQKDMLNMLDTSNPYLNMENSMEDLTVNQKQAEFERESINQQQSNIMNQLKQGAGSSGIAALAQTLAQQGQLAAQKSSATIGQQEAGNNLAKAKEASSIQTSERQGEMMSRQMEFGKLDSQMGLTMQSIAREREMQYGMGGQAAASGQQAAAGLGDTLTDPDVQETLQGIFGG